MNKYTKEYLTTPGNIIDLDYNEPVSADILGAHSKYWVDTTILIKPMEIYKTILYLGKECILIEKPRYTGETFYIVPLSEFERIGAIKEEEELPKYWVVKNDQSQLFKDTVIKYLFSNYQMKWLGCDKNSYYGVDGSDLYFKTNTYYDITSFQNNPKLLTIQEFIKLSGMGTNNKEQDKEIIGYLTPYDLFDGNVKKGTMYIDSENTYCNGTYFIPSEIMRTWEPVYKSKVKEEIVKIGDIEVKITSEGKIVAEGREFKEYQIRTLLGQIKAFKYQGLSWEVNIETIKIGCKENIHWSKLELILEVYDKLNPNSTKI